MGLRICVSSGGFTVLSLIWAAVVCAAYQGQSGPFQSRSLRQYLFEILAKEVAFIPSDDARRYSHMTVFFDSLIAPSSARSILVFESRVFACQLNMILILCPPRLERVRASG